LNLQFMGGMKLSVDGATNDLHDLMMYKGVLIEGMPRTSRGSSVTRTPHGR
jgi:hypothetical protein